jgi:hypothetical protein
MITLIGSVFPFLINALYDFFFNKPALDIIIQPYSSSAFIDFASIDIINNGMTAATNVSIKIDAPTKIINITNLKSFDNFTILFPKINDSILQVKETLTINNNTVILYIPKLIPGSGSSITLMTFIDTSSLKDINSFYRNPDLVSAKYDQGSNNGHLVVNDPFAPTMSNFIFILYYLLYFFFILVIFPRLIYKWRRKRIAFRIYQEIITIRDQLLLDSKNTFDNFEFKKAENIKKTSTMRYFFMVYRYMFNNLKRKSLQQEIRNKDIALHTLKYFDSQDYYKISNFYKKLEDRNKHIIYIDLFKLNKECSELAEDLIKNINWKKYF